MREITEREIPIINHLMKEAKVFVEHIYEALLKIKSYTNGLNRDSFLANSLVQDAVIRNLELIGVASKNIQDDFKKKYDKIEWNKMSGMRHKLNHDFIGVDLWAIWALIDKILPGLESQISEIIIQESSSTH